MMISVIGSDPEGSVSFSDCDYLIRKNKMKLNQKQLIDKLVEFDDSYHKYEYSDFVNNLTDVIEQLIKEGHEVKLDNFGVFVPKVNKEFTTHNLKTGDRVTYPSSITMSFKPSVSLQQRIKEHTNDSTKD